MRGKLLNMKYEKTCASSVNGEFLSTRYSWEIKDAITGIKGYQSIGNGGRDRMVKKLSTRYKYITRHDIERYLQLFESSQQKQKGIKKGSPSSPWRCGWR